MQNTISGYSEYIKLKFADNARLIPKIRPLPMRGSIQAVFHLVMSHHESPHPNHQEWTPEPTFKRNHKE